MSFLKHLFGLKQAELVSVWIEREDDKSNGWVAILNKSNAPVYKIVLSIVNIQSKASNGKDTPLALRSYLELAPPGKVYAKIEVHHGMSFISGIEIAFIDSNGNTWLRSGDGKLNKIKQTPIEYYNLNLPISWDRPYTEIP